jgi:hypothetical protein
LYLAAVVLEQLEDGKLQRIQEGKETIEELVSFVAFMTPEALKTVLGPPDMTQTETEWIYSKKESTLRRRSTHLSTSIWPIRRTLSSNTA